jgi:putative ABC transport system permease protein
MIRLRWRSIFHRSEVEAELDEELRGHLERHASESRRLGVPMDEAAYAARRAMRGLEQAKEDCRDMRGVTVIEELIQDLRYAARILRKSPTFTVVATLTLALGVGINATMFSVVDAVVLRALPFDQPNQLVRIYATKDGANVGGPSALDVRDVARTAQSFERMAAYDQWPKNVAVAGGSGRPERMMVGLVPKEYFQTLGVAPLFGRLFTDDENRFGNHYVAAISQRLWQDRFGGSRDVIGKPVLINAEPYTIVAVMPDVIPEWLEARGVPIRIWTPFAPAANLWAEESRRDRGYTAIGRLRPGVSIEQGRAELSRLAMRLAATFPVDARYGLTAVPLVDTRIGTLRPILVILAGAVAFVLMIACANLANLLFARNATRQRELLLRTALGAGRSRLVRQLLVETFALAALGAVVGFVLSIGGCAALSRWHPATLSQLSELTINGRVLAFALIVSLLTGLGFGLGPAWSTSRIDLAAALRGGGRVGTATSAQRRVRSGLVIAETALALMLVTATALLTQSVLHLQHQDLGFPADHLLKARVYLPPARYHGPAAIAQLSDRLGTALRDLPGVRGATVATGYPPVAARWVQPVSTDGQADIPIEDRPTAYLGITDDWFLRTVGIRLLLGRDFTTGDAADRPAVGLVNETFARRFFPKGNALGQRVRLGAPITPVEVPRAITIVGVFRDVKNDGLGTPPQPQILGLYRQLPEFNSAFKDIVVRSIGDPGGLAAPIRTALSAMDADIPLAEVSTIDDVVSMATGGLAYTTTLLGAFAVLGLGLAAIGIYGVVAYGVTQRTAEIGVRMAIGATPPGVLWMIVRGGVGLGSLGAVLGLVGSLASGRALANQLFGVSMMDPTTFVGTAAALIVVAAVASVIPAWRATQIDPVRALRGE